jgi:hypothetical protein
MQSGQRTITGVVNKADISPGSKSAHRGVVLRTQRGEEFVLRRAGGNAFQDDTLEALVGTTISGRGLVSGQTFILQDWTAKNAK